MDSANSSPTVPENQAETVSEQELGWLSPADRELARLADAWDRLFERLGPLPTQPEA